MCMRWVSYLQIFAFQVLKERRKKEKKVEEAAGINPAAAAPSQPDRLDDSRSDHSASSCKCISFLLSFILMLHFRLFIFIYSFFFFFVLIVLKQRKQQQPWQKLENLLLHFFQSQKPFQDRSV